MNAVAAASGGASEEGFRRVYDRLDGPGGLVERTSENEHKVDKHEAICAVRYEAINNQLWWMRYLMIALLLATLLEPRQLIQAAARSMGVDISLTKVDPAKTQKAP